MRLTILVFILILKRILLLFLLYRLYYLLLFSFTDFLNKLVTYIRILSKKQNKKKKTKKKTYMLDKRPQRKATCLKVTVMAPKKPNSATRKVAKLSFTGQTRDSYGYIPGIKHNLQKFATVLVRGGRTKDLPGMKYKLIRGVLDLKGVQNRFKARSKYGIKKL
jgi:small subunit ribosomal protein S12